MVVFVPWTAAQIEYHDSHPNAEWHVRAPVRLRPQPENEEDDTDGAQEALMEERGVEEAARNELLRNQSIARSNHHRLTAIFDQRQSIITQSGLVVRHELKKISEARLCFTNVNVFAHDKPTLRPSSVVQGHGKQYMYGGYENAFHYCHSVSHLAGHSVLLDEMIPHRIPPRMFFDLEVKTVPFNRGCVMARNEDTQKLLPVLMQHVQGSVEYANSMRLSQNYSPSEEKVKRLLQNYLHESSLPFAEDVCLAGMVILLETIQGALRMLMRGSVSDGGRPWEAMHVSSACRANKFSLHVIMDNIYCDRSTLSMPLIANEVAKHLGMMNTFHLLSHDEAEWITPAGKFRLRLLMIEQMMADKFRFIGQRDSVVDGNVYGFHHFLRVAGATKPDGSCVLHPITIPARLQDLLETKPTMMKRSIEFCDAFPNTASGMALWLHHTVGHWPSQLHEFKRYMFIDWTPSAGHVAPRAWNRGKRLSDTAEYCFRVNDHRKDFIFVKQDAVQGARYREYRRMVNIPLTPEEVAVFGQGIDWTGTKRYFDPEDCFKCQESTDMVPFNDISPGEEICHRHDGQDAPEERSSAKVWHGRTCRGFFCHTCNIFFIAREGVPGDVEERYPFLPSEIRYAPDNPEKPGKVLPYIADPNYTNQLDWGEMLRKKFVIIDAPMGSGKTEELRRLMTLLKNPIVTKKTRVCMVTFRVSLALQMAKRLGVKCYKISEDSDITQSELDELIRNDKFDFIVICVNSLAKLGHLQFGLVVFDECGLIRLHCLSPITTPVLPKIWTRLIGMIKSANNVILAQDFVAEADVEFYSALDDVEPTDRSKVHAFRFVKPIEIHDVEYTKQFSQATKQMLQSYEDAFDPEGNCTHPFMVLVTKVSMAIFLVHLLRTKAEEMWPDNTAVRERNIARIQGIWRAVRLRTRFAKAFLVEPNKEGKNADVVVATSIIGAGFSIDTHFTSFHAFLFRNILDHWMELQFLQRLRKVLADLGVEAAKQSYIYVQEGTGYSGEGREETNMEKIMEKFNQIRKEIQHASTQVDDEIMARFPNYIKQLEIAQAAVAQRSMTSNQHHDTLMMEYGKNGVVSKFEEMTSTVTEAYDKTLKLQCRNFLKNHLRDIADSFAVMKDEEYDNMDVEDVIMMVYDGDMREIMVSAGSEVLSGDWNSSFNSASVAKEILDRKYGNAQNEQHIKAINSPVQIMTKVQHLACWLCYVYQDLRTEEDGALVFDEFFRKRYNTTTCRNASGLMLAASVLPDLLGGATSCGSVVQPGSTPFYNEARITRYHDGWAGYWRDRFEPKPNDSMAMRMRRKKERTCLSVLYPSGTLSNRLKKLYKESPKGRKKDEYHAWSLVVLLCKRVGLTLKSCSTIRPLPRSKCSDGVVRTTWRVDLDHHDIALMLLNKKLFCQRIHLMLPDLMNTHNMSPAGKEKMRAGTAVYDEAITASLTRDDSITGLKADALRLPDFSTSSNDPEFIALAPARRGELMREVREARIEEENALAEASENDRVRLNRLHEQRELAQAADDSEEEFDGGDVEESQERNEEIVEVDERQHIETVSNAMGANVVDVAAVTQTQGSNSINSRWMAMSQLTMDEDLESLASRNTSATIQTRNGSRVEETKNGNNAKRLKREH